MALEIYYIGQEFIDSYPPDAAVWCDNNNAYIRQDGNKFIITKQPDPEPIDTTDFDNACEQFRQVCRQIGEFIGNPNFKGGFDEYTIFINSPAVQQNPAQGSLLASAWAGVNEYAKYEGSKIGYDQPEWWYKCWNIDPNQN